MLIAGFSQAYALRARKNVVGNRISWAFFVKLFLVTVQIFLVSVQATLSPVSGIIRASIIINALATVSALSLHYIELYKLAIPSGSLLFYWLFLVFLNLARLINLTLRHQNHSQFATLVILSTVNAFAILILELAVPSHVTSLVDLRASKRLSPYDTANIFSRLTFDWMAGLMKKGYRQFLTERDLPPLPQNLKASSTTKDFTHYYEAQNTTSPSLVKALFQAFGAPFLLGGVFKGIQDCMAFVQPQLLRALIKFVTDYSQSVKDGEPLPLTRGYMIAGSMFLVSITQTAFLHQYFMRAFDLGMKIKSSLTSVIYNKSLVLSNETRTESNTGDIVNLMSVDVQRLQDLVQNLQIIWLGPFQIVLCLVSLHNLLGYSMWAGVVIMIIMIPLNGFIARVQKRLQKTQMKYKDERSRLTSEILTNIKSLKLFGWENAYLDKLNHVRNDKELNNLRKMGVFSAVSTSTWNLAPFLVSCLTFAVFVLTQKHRTLLTDIVFPALALFNLLSFPLAMVPMVITNVVEAQVAVSRLSKFLRGSELQREAVTRLPRAEKKGDVAVLIKDGTFLWSKAKGNQNYKVALSAINILSRKGDLDCIVGKVGLGKSSIIQAMLGDLYKLDGEVMLHGKVAYVSQIPWIMNGLVKDNILFGHKYDPEFYDVVLKACALSVDLQNLTDGDRTEVGEKGISLSGGQKARLSLARAVYARADVYLLDDPLSAVDEHVGRHLVDHVIGPHGLLSSKCRILATNSINVLSIASNIYMVSEGRVIEQGTFANLMKDDNSKTRVLISEFGRKNSPTPPPSDSKPTLLDQPQKPAIREELDSDCEFDRGSLRRASEASLDEEERAQIDGTNEEADALVQARAEHSEKGSVKWDVYKAYAKACNPFSVLIFLGCTVLSMAVNVSSNVWLKHWSEVNTEYGYNPDVTKYLGIYFLLGVGFLLASLIQSCFMWIFCTIHGSRRLHNAMAKSVIRAPMSFFEVTPVGRITNRFSNDIYKIDEVLGRVFGMFFSNATKVIFTIGVICFSTWQFVFIMLPLAGLYVYYQQYYLKTSRELKRLDSISRSPIFANFQESLSGVSVIRAYGQQNRFMHLNERRVDRNMSAFNPAINANRWLAIRLEFLGSIIILGAAGLAIVTLRSGHLTAGLVGLSVSYSLQITQSLNWIVRMTVEVETNIVCVERVLEYSKLVPEAPEIIPNHRPAPNWPDEGEIKFEDYSVRYRPELNLVLKNINLAINSREKIGIVGRTGAGKSSITLALFRIIEAASGHIAIDNLNTLTIGLADLRHRLSIIPQDSQVLEGTIKSNLDPMNEYSDEQIWNALELSHLKTHVMRMFEEVDHEDNKSIPTGLDVKITESGSNLSIGQRQLMCLSRVLLKLNSSNVLVLDEATAAVDVETDKILQETIRDEFRDKTIITIAHRLNTIMDSDRIIVLEQGEVAEFDTPANLLKKKDLLFYLLCKQGGFVEDE